MIDLIEEILSRLPVKSLLRFRCVSKPWRSLIGRKSFITKQLKDSKRNTTLAHQRALLCPHHQRNLSWAFPRELFECSVRSLFSKPDIHALELNFAATSNVTIDSLLLVGSCNGLVCILLNSEEFVLWNPSTRTSKKLPHLSNAIIDIDGGGLEPLLYGFGCDEWSGDYKVVVIWDSEEYSSTMYSLKSDSWKKISNPWEDHLDMPFDQQVKLESGKLHWGSRIGQGGRSVEVRLKFDLKREVFEMVEECVCSLKKTSIEVEIDKSSRVRTRPSLDECINPHIQHLMIFDRSSAIPSISLYDFLIYIESLETLD